LHTPLSARASVASTCITETQLQALLAAANQSPASADTGAGGGNASTTPDTPPIIQINGDNPATVNIGDTYADLGATIEGPQQDLNLGITAYVNGAPMNPIQLDTTQAATDTIDYVATDSQGLTATSTRQVIIQSANDNQASSTLTAANDNAASTTP
jgi:hypothetical protein